MHACAGDIFKVGDKGPLCILCGMATADMAKIDNWRLAVAFLDDTGAPEYKSLFLVTRSQAMSSIQSLSLVYTFQRLPPARALEVAQEASPTIMSALQKPVARTVDWSGLGARAGKFTSGAVPHAAPVEMPELVADSQVSSRKPKPVRKPSGPKAAPKRKAVAEKPGGQAKKNTSGTRCRVEAAGQPSLDAAEILRSTRAIQGRVDANAGCLAGVTSSVDTMAKSLATIAKRTDAYTPGDTKRRVDKLAADVGKIASDVEGVKGVLERLVSEISQVGADISIVKAAGEHDRQRTARREEAELALLHAQQQMQSRPMPFSPPAYGGVWGGRPGPPGV